MCYWGCVGFARGKLLSMRRKLRSLSNAKNAGRSIISARGRVRFQPSTADVVILFMRRGGDYGMITPTRREKDEMQNLRE